MEENSELSGPPETQWVERRIGFDRRQAPHFPPRFSAARRRRSSGRRRTDQGGYVDIYDRGSWMMALGVMGLSFLDAILTMLQLRGGEVREANPLMNLAIAWGGIYTFFSLKAAMTSFALAIIILHKEWPLARYMVRLCLWAYISILCYHVYLVSRLGGLNTLLR